MTGIIICTDECNLSCRYCYEHSTNRQKRLGRTVICDAFLNASEHIERFVDLVYSESNRREEKTQFIFHGGEPLLVEPEYLKQIFNYILKHGKASMQIQTNGTLITEKLADILSVYDVDVVVSLDGPPFIHDRYRVNPSGSATSYRVINGIKLLQSRNVQVSAMATITEYSSKYAREMWTYFSELGIDFTTNRCFRVGSNEELNVGVTEDGYRAFLSELYDIYIDHRHNHSESVHITCFDRCMHDLKREADFYYYRYTSALDIAVFKVGEVKGTFLKKKDGAIRFQHRTEKSCIIDLLILQQNESFENAMGIYGSN